MTQQTLPRTDDPQLDVANLTRAFQLLRVQVSNRAFAVKLVMCAAVVTAGAFLTLADTLWVRILGTLIVGIMFAHALELQHETLHNIAFRNRRANAIAGIALGVPMLVSFAAYQVLHLRHHRDLGTPDNREFFDYGDQYGETRLPLWQQVWLWFYRLSMIGHYRQFVENVGRVVSGRPLPGERPATIRRMRHDYLVILSLIAAGTVASVLVGSLALVWVWAVPLVVVAAPVHALIELPEHFGCDTSTTNVLANSRTIRSNAFMTWLVNTNNFHVEHHMMPRLPFAHLSSLHHKVASRARYSERSYSAFFWGMADRKPRASS